MDREQQILKYMKSLDISREEAEQLWEDDQEDFESEEMAEMGKKAKEIMRTIHGAEDENKKNKKNAPRERKENPTKRQIIQDLLKTVQDFSENAQITNPEKYISFQIGEDLFEINLIQKRKQKK